MCCRYAGFIYLGIANILLVGVRLYKFMRYHRGECCQLPQGQVKASGQKKRLGGQGEREGGGS